VSLARMGSWSLEAWPLGWVLCSTSGTGVPMEALSCAVKMLERLYCKKEAKRLVMGLCIVNYVKKRCNSRAVFVIGDPDCLSKWEEQIKAALAGCSREEQWWCGCDVGLSSKLLFATLGDEIHSEVRHARLELKGAVQLPQDGADFGRCVRLLQLFPEWKARLPEVAARWPQWAGMVEHWDELEALPGGDFQAALDAAKKKSEVVS